MATKLKFRLNTLSVTCSLLIIGEKSVSTDEMMMGSSMKRRDVRLFARLFQLYDLETVLVQSAEIEIIPT